MAALPLYVESGAMHIATAHLPFGASVSALTVDFFVAVSIKFGVEKTLREQ